MPTIPTNHVLEIHAGHIWDLFIVFTFYNQIFSCVTIQMHLVIPNAIIVPLEDKSLESSLMDTLIML